MKYLLVQTDCGMPVGLVGYRDSLSTALLRDKILAQVRETQGRVGSTCHTFDLRRLERDGWLVVIVEFGHVDSLRLPHYTETNKGK